MITSNDAVIMFCINIQNYDKILFIQRWIPWGWWTLMRIYDVISIWTWFMKIKLLFLHPSIHKLIQSSLHLKHLSTYPSIHPSGQLRSTNELLEQIFTEVSKTRIQWSFKRDEWMDGWTDGWMDGGMDGWTDECQNWIELVKKLF